ncbi:MAG: TatA/E family twin arginine-targeting protein translocase [Anaerolineae bacterium]
MFGLGPAEVVLVLVIALIVFGPGRLPEIGQALGKSMREFREASSEITQELSREIEATERAVHGETESTKQEKPADEGA